MWRWVVVDDIRIEYFLENRDVSGVERFFIAIDDGFALFY